MFPKEKWCQPYLLDRPGSESITTGQSKPESCENEPRQDSSLALQARLLELSICTKGKEHELIYKDACYCQEGMPDYSHWLGFSLLMDLNSWREAEPDTEPKPSSSVCRLAHFHSLRVHSHAGEAEQHASETCSSPMNQMQLIL